MFGVVGPGIVYKDIKALESLGFVSELRGRHGTGIIQGRMYNSYLELEVDKTNLDFASHLEFNEEIKFRSPKGRKFFESVTDNVFLCHVRHATVGGINPDNSHPFQYNNVIGMHNGTLVTKEFLPSGDTADLTDSAIFYSKVDSEGYKAVIERLSDQDAFAFVFADIKGGKIRIVRNKKRTLYWAVDAQRNVFWYASEASFLNFIAERHDLDLTDPEPFDTDTVYSFVPTDVTSNKAPSWETEKVFTRGAPTPRYEKMGKNYHEESGNVFDVSTAPWDDGWDKAWDEYYRTYPASENRKPLEKEDTKEAKPKISMRDGISVCTRPRAIPKTTCGNCMKDMSLYDLYVGTDYGQGVGEHFNCGE